MPTPGKRIFRSRARHSKRCAPGGVDPQTSDYLASPGDIAELVTDEVLDAVGIAGEPEKASEQLASFLPGVPGLTGLRYKLPPLTGPDSVEQFNEMIDHAGQASDNIRTQLSRVT